MALLLSADVCPERIAESNPVLIDTLLFPALYLQVGKQEKRPLLLPFNYPSLPHLLPYD
jgi:hypothetical protein